MLLRCYFVQDEDHSIESSTYNLKTEEYIKSISEIDESCTQLSALIENIQSEIKNDKLNTFHVSIAFQIDFHILRD